MQINQVEKLSKKKSAYEKFLLKKEGLGNPSLSLIHYYKLT